jgi:hypothetical protein
MHVQATSRSQTDAAGHVQQAAKVSPTRPSSASSASSNSSRPSTALRLLRCVAHGAADLALAGHRSPEGKGRSDAAGIVDDLLDHLHQQP